MFSESVWNKIRFNKFGNELSDRLKDQNKKNALRKLFKDQNDKLSYFDMFQFIEHTLGISL